MRWSHLIIVIYILFACLQFYGCASNQKTGKLSFVSIDEEIAMGKEFAFHAPQRFKIIRNQEITTFLNQIAQEIGVQSDWSGLRYTVYLINEPDINHFSLPGGNIYIYRGLVEICISASEVAAAIAHEIAHSAARNSVERMAAKYGYALAAQSVMGQNPEIPSQIITNLYSRDTILDYSKKAEQEADRNGIKYAWKANYDPTGMIYLLIKTRQIEQQNPAKVSLLLKIHPSTISRYRIVNNELKYFASNDSLRKDLAEFSRIKELLSKIPY